MSGPYVGLSGPALAYRRGGARKPRIVFGDHLAEPLGAYQFRVGHVSHNLADTPLAGSPPVPARKDHCQKFRTTAESFQSFSEAAHRSTLGRTCPAPTLACPALPWLILGRGRGHP